MNSNSLIYKLFILKINENNILLDIELTNTEKYRTNNNFVYQLVFSQDINQDFKKNNITGEGNYFSCNLSFFYIKNENYYSFFCDILY